VTRAEHVIRADVARIKAAAAQVESWSASLAAERDATLEALNERRDRLIAVAIELDILRAERDAALAVVARVRGALLMGGQSAAIRCRAAWAALDTTATDDRPTAVLGRPT
jgi:hypothetical protein